MVVNCLFLLNKVDLYFRSKEGSVEKMETFNTPGKYFSDQYVNVCYLLSAHEN